MHLGRGQKLWGTQTGFSLFIGPKKSVCPPFSKAKKSVLSPLFKNLNKCPSPFFKTPKSVSPPFFKSKKSECPPPFKDPVPSLRIMSHILPVLHIFLVQHHLALVKFPFPGPIFTAIINTGHLFNLKKLELYGRPVS